METRIRTKLQETPKSTGKILKNTGKNRSVQEKVGKIHENAGKSLLIPIPVTTSTRSRHINTATSKTRTLTSEEPSIKIRGIGSYHPAEVIGSPRAFLEIARDEKVAAPGSRWKPASAA